MSNAATTESNLSKVTLDSLRFGRSFVTMMLEKTPDELFYKPAFEGANHAAWVVGHLATTDEFFYKSLAGGEGALPASWDTLFGMNSVCEADARTSCSPSRAIWRCSPAPLRSWAPRSPSTTASTPPRSVPPAAPRACPQCSKDTLRRI